jgi:hypothetical protein
MSLISSDTIRDISVKSVEMFLNDKVPLSQGLAKQASAYDLNSEQIHRAVEATNSIAYLKVLELASDRTVEFPLCKYAEVMASIVVPEMSKQASIKEDKPNIISDESLEKFAEYVPPNLSEQELKVHFVKMASMLDRQIGQLEDRAITIVPELEKVAYSIKLDSEGLEKLATIVSGKEFAVMSALVYGSVQKHSDTGLFKSAELKDAEKLFSLYKEAKEVQAGIDKCKSQLERTGHVKEAFFGAVAGAVGKSIGRAIGSVAAVPAKGLGRAIGNTGSNVMSKVNAGATRVENSLTGKKTPIPAVTKKMGIGAVGMGLGTAALDATLYQPGATKMGTSKDVWNALQRS